MPRTLQLSRMIRIGKATREVIEHWKEGVSLQSDSTRPIDDLLRLVTTDRWRLAFEHRRHANKLFLGSPPQNRCAVSRYYYSMYHAMRACAFIYHGGDDFEAHSTLPSKIPDDFDRTINWQNELKNARLTRNSADYDAYPKADRAWQPAAYAIKQNADLLLNTSKLYLRSKGCNL